MALHGTKIILTLIKQCLKSGLSDIQKRYSTEAKIKTEPYQLHRLDEGPSAEIICTKEDALKYFKTMTAMRLFENATAALYQEKLIRGFLHIYSGQEAIATGFVAAFRPQDVTIGAYRIHCWAYALGTSIKDILCELTGRATGNSRGRGGSMHMYNPRMLGGIGIVGAQTSVGAGIAFALKYKETGGICVTTYGDGAANQGQLFESFNMAKLWNLPVVFLCENNEYAMGTSVERGTANPEFYKRGDVVPGILVDGMDVFSCKECGRFAYEYAVKNGPIVIEARTYRYVGHSMSDPGTTYRTREEIQDVRQTRDPIMKFKEKAIAAGLITEEEIQSITKEVKAEVATAVQAAKSDPPPKVEEIANNVYCENIEKKIKSPHPFKFFEAKLSGTASCK